MIVLFVSAYQYSLLAAGSTAVATEEAQNHDNQHNKTSCSQTNCSNDSRTLKLWNETSNGKHAFTSLIFLTKCLKRDTDIIKENDVVR